MAEKKTKDLTVPVLIAILVVAAALLGSLWTKVRSLEKGNVQGLKVTPNQPAGQTSPAAAEPQLESTVGNFSVTKDEVCQENGKPIIYFFGSTSCPHCVWEKPVLEAVTKKFGNLISFHENIDDFQKDSETLDKYSSINKGAVPFLIFGCRYVRVGSGEMGGKEAEDKNLTAIICKLTGDKPANVCAGVKDLVSQVK